MRDNDINNDITKSGDSEWSSSPPGEPEGARLIVFTSEYLLERGYCCGNGCVNCPYDYKAVAEPKRSALLNARKNTNKDL